jgi:hypothetical protein
MLSAVPHEFLEANRGNDKITWDIPIKYSIDSIAASNQIQTDYHFHSLYYIIYMPAIDADKPSMLFLPVENPIA